MTEERFAEILAEYGFTDEDIRWLWAMRPKDRDISESVLRATCLELRARRT